MNRGTKVCFLADKHGLYDDRIYWKMAISLIKRGYEIYYLFIGEKEESGITSEGVTYHSFKLRTLSNNRYVNYVKKNHRRPTNYTRMYQKAKEIEADVYHFHDLNINRIGKKLKKLKQNPVVIYDARDPFAVNIKDYFGKGSKIKWLLGLYAAYIDRWEKNCAKKYDMVISNEENVANLFKRVLPDEKVEVIYNYTFLHHFRKEIPKNYDLIYCGAITEYRGAIKIIEAIRCLKETHYKIKMIFLGPIFSDDLKLKMEKLILKYNLSGNIELKGKVPYLDVATYYNQSKIGLGIFLPIETHKITLQIKVFEYMAMGLPIIGSNFGHINNYILKDQAGLVVKPTEPKEIAEAARTLLDNKALYEQYKINGIKAAEEKYNWPLMEKKLFKIYETQLEQRKIGYEIK